MGYFGAMKKEEKKAASVGRKWVVSGWAIGAMLAAPAAFAHVVKPNGPALGADAYFAAFANKNCALLTNGTSGGLAEFAEPETDIGAAPGTGAFNSMKSVAKSSLAGMTQEEIAHLAALCGLAPEQGN